VSGLGKHLIILAAALLAVTVVRANAVFVSGNDLLTNCQSEIAVDRMYCLAYIAGIFDVIESNTINGFRACIPSNGVTSDQVRDIAVRFLREHPEKRHLGARPGCPRSS
jgi:hypothetical protein